MRILVVGNDVYQDAVANIITKSKFTCRENIIPLLNIEKAEYFILNNLMNEGKHIDLIIVDDDITYNRFHKNLCDWIRSIEVGSYSKGNFRISSIPIMLLKENDVKENTFETGFNNKYNVVLSLKKNGYDGKIKYYGQKVVKEFREDILTDLDTLNIKVDNVRENSKLNLGWDYNKFTNNSLYYLSRTKVLSQEFIKSPKHLDYPWLSNQNLIEIEQSLDQYEKIIKRLKFNGRAFERRVLHAFYNKFKHFLLRDTYEKLIYDKRFVISSTSHYHIPDFILTSPFPEFLKTSISEIKRHNIFFQYLPKQHKNFTSYFQNALNQSSNYEDDFNNLKWKSYLTENIGNPIDKFQIDLIIGLDERINEFILNKMKKHYSTINLVTHNSLKQKTEEFYYRSKATTII